MKKYCNCSRRQDNVPVDIVPHYVHNILCSGLQPRFPVVNHIINGFKCEDLGSSSCQVIISALHLLYFDKSAVNIFRFINILCLVHPHIASCGNIAAWIALILDNACYCGRLSYSQYLKRAGEDFNCNLFVLSLESLLSL